mmetsp:Transcript_5915/g.36679  ORF Transcript_5915/g.36679 Transcript_5915/m.36679 type:complete len:204 (+) Transcript_5915:2076-2687(+)
MFCARSMHRCIPLSRFHSSFPSSIRLTIRSTDRITSMCPSSHLPCFSHPDATRRASSQCVAHSAMPSAIVGFRIPFLSLLTIELTYFFPLLFFSFSFWERASFTPREWYEVLFSLSRQWQWKGRDGRGSVACSTLTIQASRTVHGHRLGSPLVRMSTAIGGSSGRKQAHPSQVYEIANHGERLPGTVSDRGRERASVCVCVCV